jgi:hypothetical protein
MALPPGGRLALSGWLEAVSYVRPGTGVGGVVYIRQGSRARSWPGSFVFLYIYPAPLGVVVGHAAWLPLEGRLAAVERLSMQDPASVLPRINLPRTPVNKSEGEGRGS